MFIFITLRKLVPGLKFTYLMRSLHTVILPKINRIIIWFQSKIKIENVSICEF
jgi:hypothetical protein